MIRRLRLARGWSQEQLALCSGLSIRTIQRIERGHNAGLESVKCIAAALDIDLSELQTHHPDSNETFLGANPILPVKGVIETANFFKDQLGFEIELLWKEPPYGVVARGETIIEFGEGRNEHAGSGVCVIFVRDVDAVHAEYSTKDIEFVGDLADRDYGSRDFRIRDNNGNMLILSTPLIDQQALLNAGKRQTV